jgi:hypothetical protein
MPDGETQFVVTALNWDPDTISRLTEAAGEGASVRVVSVGEIVHIENDRWLSEGDLRNFLLYDPVGDPSWAIDIFEAMLAFNERMGEYRVEAQPEIMEEILLEHGSANLSTKSIIAQMLRLHVDKERKLVAASSVIALAGNSAALAALGFTVQNGVALKKWAASLQVPVPA